MALYVVTALLLVTSWMLDREKTRRALRQGWKSFMGILPPMVTVTLLAAGAVALMPPEVLASLLGEKSGILGALGASLVGSITLIPGFVAFPLAKTLLDGGAGVPQIAVFLSTLMMVGVVTFPLESKIFGSSLAFARNALAYVFSLLVGAVFGMLGMR
ncbi:MAG TPA: permease [Synergistaceae bacterium]|nr:permease [Synergistaceae bacterium]